MNASISVGESDGGLFAAYMDWIANGLLPLIAESGLSVWHVWVLWDSTVLAPANSASFNVSGFTVGEVSLSLFASDGARELSCVATGVTSWLSTTGTFCSSS